MRRAPRPCGRPCACPRAAATPAASDAGGEERVVRARDQVDRLAHQRRVDDRAALERLRQVIALEPLTTTRGGCSRSARTGSGSPEPLHDPRQRQAHALEQELAREQRAVELALREDALAHRRPSGARAGAAPRRPPARAPTPAAVLLRVLDCERRRADHAPAERLERLGRSRGTLRSTRGRLHSSSAPSASEARIGRRASSSRRRCPSSPSRSAGRAGACRRTAAGPS